MRLPGPALPADAVLPRLVGALADAPSAVLVAPPGAGKTTRAPLALAGAPWLAPGHTVVMLEPRRVAARAAARRLAAAFGERVGATVGLRVRGESTVGPAARIEVVTEGVLVRRLLADPALDGAGDIHGARAVGVVVFDEFHERSLDGDLGLALALHAQALLRPDLRILVMSATLDGARVAALLGPGTPVVESEGRMFAVGTRWRGRPPDRAGGVEDAVAAAVRHALAHDDGSVLAFLPGTAEIRRTADRLAGLCADGPESAVDVRPLSGDLAPDAQDAALAPPPPGRRKVVLATNVAETSVTVEGVTVVVDSGLARRPRHDPATGMSRLETVRVSRAEADQRRGRAGRQAPGTCYRLWSEADDAVLAPFAPPEIATADLAPLALALAAFGADADELTWLDPPPAAALAAGRDLLAALGALDASGCLTGHGRALAALPMHPRLGHLALVARASGHAALAADLAALLSERDLARASPGARADADLRLRVEALREGRAPGLDVDRGALARVRAEAARLRRAWRASGEADPDATGALLALAYPERVAQKTGESARDARFRLRDGRTALLDAAQPPADAPFLAVAHLDDRSGPGGVTAARIFLAAPLSADEIAAAFPDDVVTDDAVAWDGARVTATRRTRLGAVVLRETRLADPDPAAVAAALAGGLAAAGLASLAWTPDAAHLRERLAFLHHHAPDDWPDVSDDALLATASDWLLPHAPAARSLADLARVDLAAALGALVPWSRRADLDRLAPARLPIPSGRAARVDYADPDAPVLAAKLQELFGLAETPAVLGGRLPVVVHLLSPAGRPVQVTRDLASFWRAGYFDVRKDLRGRYPKHPWPDDPTTAPATARTTRRR